MTSKKLHNPKSHSPAIYIPCWLSQVPNKLISHGAKLVYGRLSQWCNSTGQAYRSASQLAIELGMCVSSVEKYQKELRKCELIGTFQPQAGGVNHFEFYDHPWMYKSIHKNLTYETTPPYDHTVPPVQQYGTPPYKHTDINIKEIKTNNNKQKIVPAAHAPTSLVKSKNLLSPTDLWQQNPHDIPLDLIQEWAEIRKMKRKPITKTVWVRLNNELGKYKGAPIEAFSEMIERGWLSFKCEWMSNLATKSNSKTRTINYQDTSW